VDSDCGIDIPQEEIKIKHQARKDLQQSRNKQNRINGLEQRCFFNLEIRGKLHKRFLLYGDYDISKIASFQG